jgi:hypothetical protein
VHAPPIIPDCSAKAPWVMFDCTSTDYTDLFGKYRGRNMKESIALRVILNEPLDEVKNLSVSCGLGRFLDSFIPKITQICLENTKGGT